MTEAASFSAAWLDLREAADHRARAVALEEALAARLAAVPQQRIVDLGAGSGSNLRALAPRLGPRQHWTLIDQDTVLADAARARLAGWADAAVADGDGLVLKIGEREVRVDFVQADLAAQPDAALAFAPHLVTASALFDLVSARWCASFAAALSGSGAIVHAALTCDGRDAWMPPHPADAAVAAAFRAHQGGDKGFGPALGPDAAQALGAALAAAGYDVAFADSPWRLAAGAGDAIRAPAEAARSDAVLMAELARGTARAAADSGRMDKAEAAAWGAARATAAAATIGHVDMLAVPRP